jgi:hypothetical protein
VFCEVIFTVLLLRLLSRLRGRGDITPTARGSAQDWQWLRPYLTGNTYIKCTRQCPGLAVATSVPHRKHIYKQHGAVPRTGSGYVPTSQEAHTPTARGSAQDRQWLRPYLTGSTYINRTNALHSAASSLVRYSKGYRTRRLEERVCCHLQTTRATAVFHRNHWATQVSVTTAT